MAGIIKKIEILFELENDFDRRLYEYLYAKGGNRKKSKYLKDLLIEDFLKSLEEGTIGVKTAISIQEKDIRSHPEHTPFAESEVVKLERPVKEEYLDEEEEEVDGAIDEENLMNDMKMFGIGV